MTAPGSGKQQAQLVTMEGWQPTYRAGAIAVTAYSTAAAVWLEIVGSASATVRLKRIRLWAQCATKFYAELTLLRCTGASAGTPTPLAAGKHDKNDANATAVVNTYAAAATAGAGSVITGATCLGISAPSASMPVQIGGWEFSANADKPCILRGTSDVLQIFNNTLTLGAGTFGCGVEWEEDQS